MKEYFIFIDGKKLGPFSFDDLLQQQILPDSPIWCGNTATPVPALQIPELKYLFRDQSSAFGRAGLGSPGPVDPGTSETKSGIKGFRAYPKSLQIALVILLIALVGGAIYFWGLKRDGVSQTDEISVIHEREVEKAKQELTAEKVARKNAEAREQLLRERKSELQSLSAQLRKVRVSRARALSDMDKIRRLHIFRSRAKKEAQISEQLQVIDRLDAKSATLSMKISSCQADVDSLSAGLAP